MQDEQIKCTRCGTTEGLFRHLHSGERMCLDCLVDRVRELEIENAHLRAFAKCLGLTPYDAAIIGKDTLEWEAQHNA